MILLLDTDVLVEVVLDRRPHAAAAADLLDLLESDAGTALITRRSLLNFHNLVRPARGGREARDFLRRLCGFVPVAPTTTEHFEIVTKLPLRDFEDALQAGAALAARAERIVTRNVRDDARSPVRACSPRNAIEFLARED